jgi:hypothetical protein
VRAALNLVEPLALAAQQDEADEVSSVRRQNQASKLSTVPACRSRTRH